jgi:hypothetical protein
MAATVGVGASRSERAGNACRVRGGQIGAWCAFAARVPGARTGADLRGRLPAVMAAGRPYPAGPGAGPGIPAMQYEEGDQQKDEDADG